MFDTIISMAKKRADAAEVFFVSSEETPVNFESNKLKNIQCRQNSRVILRIIKNGRFGISIANRIEDGEKLIANAIEASEFGPEAHFELPAGQNYAEIEVYDEQVNNLSIDRMITIGNTLIEKLISHTPALLCEVHLNKAVSDVSIMNSNGGSSSYKKSSFFIAAEGILIRNTDMLFVMDMQGSCRLDTGIEVIYRNIAEQLERAKTNAGIKSGLYPVIFAPYGVASAFISPLAVAFNGRMVLRGASPLTEAKGKKFFSESLTLIDDATLPYLLRSRKFDDEGMSSKKNILINNGIVHDFLYDLQTAAMAKEISTGSAHRIAGGIPTPTICNIAIAAGNTSFSQILQDTREGLLVEQLMGADQGNILSGEFSGNVLLGYKIENGNIAGRVKDTVISGNTYQALTNLSAISKERDIINGSMILPYLRCENIEVASKE